MNSIYARKRKENEKGHSYFAEKRKRKSPHNISGFFLFHTYSVTKLLVIQCAAMHGAQKVISKYGVPNNSLPSRIRPTTKVLKNCKTFSSRPRPRRNGKTKSNQIKSNLLGTPDHKTQTGS